MENGVGSEGLITIIWEGGSVGGLRVGESGSVGGLRVRESGSVGGLRVGESFCDTLFLLVRSTEGETADARAMETF